MLNMTSCYRETNRDQAEQKQIWVMNLDGSGAHNLSQNQYNDWDPIWVK